MKLLILIFLTTTFSSTTQESISTTIHFQSNQHQLSTASKSKLSKTLKSISPQNIIRIALIGHCDSDGDIIYNQKLSERRSQATLNYLLVAGINKNRIEIYSKGEVEPKGDNSTEAGKAVNRRVELTIIFRKN